MKPAAQRRIAVALSGGGIRAALFHLGVLTYLAERDLLSQVRYISTVSGGTLLTGLIFHQSGLRWPSSSAFLSDVLPAVNAKIARVDLQASALLRLVQPWNWRYLPFRANVLAATLRTAWGITARLHELPASPIWAINATTMESGRRWRFRGCGAGDAPGRHSMGDGALGYCFDERFLLAEAMATSAAFPGGLSPFVLKTGGREWFIPDFEDTTRPARPASPRFRSYHLADGGVYDNLALEPVFDIGTGRMRDETECDYLIASDAGAPLDVCRWTVLSQLVGFAKRTIDVMSAQQRNLRVRALVSAFAQDQAAGVFLNIGEAPRVGFERGRRARPAEARALETHAWLTNEQARASASYPTTLRTPKPADAAMIQRHGYETAKVQCELWG
jgi:NTE family protein